MKGARGQGTEFATLKGWSGEKSTGWPAGVAKNSRNRAGKRKWTGGGGGGREKGDLNLEFGGGRYRGFKMELGIGKSLPSCDQKSRHQGSGASFPGG